MGLLICGNTENRNKIKNEFVPEEKFKGSLKAVKQDNNKYSYVRRKHLIYSQTINEIMDRFFLTRKEMGKIWDFFKKIDKKRAGYITADDLYLLLHEKKGNSIIAPYLDRFFVMIEKTFVNKACFEEFIPNLISYNLYSPFQVVQFVFNFLDKDMNGYISKIQILKMINLTRDSERIYYINHKDAVENYKDFARTDKISLEEFTSACEKMPFIYFPAIQFQNSLRDNYIGIGFWEDLQVRVRNNHVENIKKKDAKEQNERMQKIRHNFKVSEYKNMNKFDKENNYYMEPLRKNRKNTDSNYYLIYKWKRKKPFRVRSIENIYLKLKND